jgi:hypothetical protein
VGSEQISRLEYETHGDVLLRFPIPVRIPSHSAPPSLLPPYPPRIRRRHPPLPPSTGPSGWGRWGCGGGGARGRRRRQCERWWRMAAAHCGALGRMADGSGAQRLMAARAGKGRRLWWRMAADSGARRRMAVDGGAWGQRTAAAVAHGGE